MNKKFYHLSPEAQERLLAIVSPVVLVVAWQFLSWAGVLDARFVPSPWQIVDASWQLLASGELARDIGASFERLAIGFVVGAVPGILVGIVMGLNRFVRAALDPIIAATYPVPKIAILPLIMLVFGIGNGSKIAIVAIAVFYIVLINTMMGVLEIDSIFFDVSRNFNAPWRKLFTRVILPGATPAIFASLRLSLGIALVVLVAAEFVAANSGIGYLIWTSWETLLINQMFVGIIVITIFGVLSTVLLKEIERLFIPWRRG